MVPHQGTGFSSTLTPRGTTQDHVASIGHQVNMKTANTTPRPLGLKQPAQRVLADTSDKSNPPPASGFMSPATSYGSSVQPSEQSSSASTGQEQHEGTAQPTPYVSVEQDKEGMWMMTPAPDMYSATSVFQTQASPGSIVSRRLTLTPMSRALTSSLEWVNGGPHLPPHLQPIPGANSTTHTGSNGMHTSQQQQQQQQQQPDSGRQPQASSSQARSGVAHRVLADSTNQRQLDGARDRHAAADDAKHQAQQQRQAAARHGVQHSPGVSVASSSGPVVAGSRLRLHPAGGVAGHHVNRYADAAGEGTPQSHAHPTSQYHVMHEAQYMDPASRAAAASARSWQDMLSSPAPGLAAEATADLDTAHTTQLVGQPNHANADLEQESQSASLDWGLQLPDEQQQHDHDAALLSRQQGAPAAPDIGSSSITGGNKTQRFQRAERHEIVTKNVAAQLDVDSTARGQASSGDESSGAVLQGSPQPGADAGSGSARAQTAAVLALSMSLGPARRRQPPQPQPATSSASVQSHNLLRPLTPSFASKFFDSDSDSSSSAGDKSDVSEDGDDVQSSLQPAAGPAAALNAGNSTTHHPAAEDGNSLQDCFTFRPPSSPGSAATYQTGSQSISPRLNAGPTSPDVFTQPQAAAAPTVAADMAPALASKAAIRPSTSASSATHRVTLGTIDQQDQHSALVEGQQQAADIALSSNMEPEQSVEPEHPAGRITTAALSKAVTRVSQLSRDKQGLESLTSELQVRLIAAEEEQEWQAQQLLLAEQHQLLLVRQLEAAEEEKGRLQRQASQLAVALVAAQAAAAAAQSQATTLTHSQQRLQEMQASQLEEKDALKLQVLALQQHLDANAETIATSQDVVSELQAALQRTKDAALGAEQRCEVLQRELEAAKARAEAAEAASSGLQLQLNAAQLKVDQLKQFQSASHAADEQVSTNQHVETLQAALLQSETRLAELDHVAEQLAAATQNIAELQALTEQQHAEILDLRESHTAEQAMHSEQFAKVEEERSQLVHQTCALQDQVVQAIRERDAAQQQLQAVQQEVQQLQLAVEEQQQHAADTLHQMSEQQLQVQGELMQLKADAQMQLEQLREAEQQLRQKYSQQLEQLTHAEQRLRREVQQVQDLQGELAAARSIGSAACQEVSSLSSQMARRLAQLGQKDHELQSLKELCEQLQQQVFDLSQNMQQTSSKDVENSRSITAAAAATDMQPNNSAVFNLTGKQLTATEQQQQLVLVTSQVSDQDLHAGATQLIELRFALGQLQQLAKGLAQQLSCNEMGSRAADFPAVAEHAAMASASKMGARPRARDGHSKEAAWVMHVLSELHTCCLDTTATLQACTERVEDSAAFKQQPAVQGMPPSAIQNPLYHWSPAVTRVTTPCAGLHVHDELGLSNGRSQSHSDHAPVHLPVSPAAEGTPAAIHELHQRCLEYHEQVQALESKLASSLKDVATNSEQVHVLEMQLAESHRQEQQLQLKLHLMQQTQEQCQEQITELDAAFQEAHDLAVAAKAAADGAQQALLVEHAARQDAEKQLIEMEHKFNGVQQALLFEHAACQDAEQRLQGMEQEHSKMQGRTAGRASASDASAQAQPVTLVKTDCQADDPSADNSNTHEQQQQQQQQGSLEVQLQQQLMALRGEAEAVVGQHEHACEQLGRLRDERSQLKTVADQLQAELAAARAQHEQQAEQLQSQVAQQQQTHSQLQQVHDALTVQLQQAEEEITQLQHAQQQLTGQLQASEQEVVHLQAEVTDLQQQTKQHASADHAPHMDLSDALDAVQDQYKLVTEQLAATQQLLRDTTAAYSQQLDVLLLGADGQASQESIGQQHTVVQVLQQQLDQYQQLLLAAHEQLQEWQQHRFDNTMPHTQQDAMPLVTAQFAQMYDAQQQVQQLQAQLAVAQHQVHDTQAELAAAHDGSQQLRALLAEQESRVQSQQQDVLQKQELIDKLEAGWSHQQALLEQTKAEWLAAGQEGHSLTAGSASTQQQLAATRAELKSVQAELAAARSALAAAQQELMQSQAEVAQMHQDLLEAAAAAAQHTAALQAVHTERQQMEAELQQVRSATEQARATAAKLQQELAEKTESEQQLLLQLQQQEELLTQAASATERLHAAEQHVEAHDQVLQQLTAANEQVAGLNKVVEQLQVQVQQLQAAHEAQQAVHKEQLSKAEDERVRLVRQVWDLQNPAAQLQLSEVTEQLRLSQQQIVQLEQAATAADALWQHQRQQLKEQYAQHDQKRVRGFKRLLAEECAKYDHAARQREQQGAEAMEHAKKQLAEFKQNVEKHWEQLQQKDLQLQQLQCHAEQQLQEQQEEMHGQLQQACSQLLHQEEQCAEYEGQMSRLSKELSDANSKCSQYEQQLLTLQAALSTSHQSCAARDVKLNEMQVELRKLTAECRHARAQLHQAVGTAADLQLKLQAASQQAQQQAVTSAHTHTEELQQAMDAMHATDDHNTQLQQQVTQLTDALDAANALNSSLSDQLASLQAYLAEQDKNARADVAAEMAAQDARARSTAAGLEVQLMEAVAAQKPLLSQIERLQAQLVSQAHEHSTAIAELQQHNKALQQQLDAAQHQLEATQQQLEAAQKQVDSEAAHAGTLHDALQAALDAVQHAEEDARAQQQAAATQLASLQAQLSHVSDADSSARVMLERTTQQLAAAEEQALTAEQRANTLQQQLQQLQQQQQGTQTQLQLAGSGGVIACRDAGVEALAEWQQLLQLKTRHHEERMDAHNTTNTMLQLASSEPAASTASVLQWTVDHLQHLQQQNRKMAKVLRRLSREGSVLQQLETVRQENQVLCCKYTAAELLAKQQQRTIQRLSAENESLTTLVKQQLPARAPLLLTQ